MQLNTFVNSYLAVPPRQRALIAAVVATLSLAAFYFLYWVGQDANLGGLKIQVEQQEASRREKQRVAADLPTFERELGRLGDELAAARKLLPDAADVPQFLAQLGTHAHDVGMRIKRFEPGNEVMHEFYAAIPFRLSVSGTYHEIAMFIDRIGGIERIVNVSNLVMKEPASQSDRALVQGTFDVQAFRFLSDEAVAAIAAKTAATQKAAKK